MLQVSNKQYQLLTCPADWVLFGGAAGGGKSYGLMLDMLRHVQGPHAQPRYRGAMFRRTYPQLSQPRGLLDTTKELFGQCGSQFNHTRSEHLFPSGAKISLLTLENEKKIEGYLGAQFDQLCIDEANQFSQKNVLFLWGRCRSACGIRPTLRMSSNPDNDSWLFPVVQWYLDSSGYPDPSKSGVIRHFRVVDDRFEWFDAPQVNPQTGRVITNSFTFIPSRLQDNEFLMKSDPEYEQRLLQLSEQERERFLEGCWLASSKTDTEWPRECFFNVVVDDHQWPSIQHQADAVRMFAVDPSKGRSTKEGDYSAITCLMQMSAAKGGLKYVDCDMRRRPPGQIIEDLFAFCDDSHHPVTSGDLVGIEATAFQELLQEQVYKYAAQNPQYRLSQFLRYGGHLVPIKDMMKKEIRIRRLDTPIRQREFRFLRNPGTLMLLSQLRQFDGQNRKGQYDDGPDSLDMCQQLPVQLQKWFDEQRK